MTDKIPPHSQEDEIRVLGSMMIDKDATEVALEVLRIEDFYDPINAIIFGAALSLHMKNMAIDISSVASELRLKNELADIGGAERLTGAIDAVSTAAHVGFHADQVKNYSILRALASRCTEIVSDCYEHEDEPKSILEKAEKYIYAISDRGMKSKLVPLSEIVTEHLDDLDKVFTKQTKTIGLETGFPSLDKLTSGLQPGNMVVIAARPGMGKTSLALDIARHAAIKQGIPTAFFSLEMTNREIFNRLISAETGIPLYGLRTGHFGANRWLEVTKAAERFHESPFYLDCSSFNISAMGIRSSCRRLASKMIREGKRLGLVVVDYLQLISSNTKKYDNRQAEVADISRSLKSIAIDLDVPILALSQLNRQTEEVGRGGRPRLSDLRESGAIEQDSDLVMFIFREALYKAGASEEEKAKTKLIIAKHRNGALGEIDFYFHKETTQFHEASRSDD